MTAEADAMAAIAKYCAPTMKAAGFKKRRHAFNRHTESGLVHVLNFQMGPFEPPAFIEVPGFAESLYGKFTINLGVWVPEMTRSDPPRSDWINEYNCHLRMRIGNLIPPYVDSSDTWWRFDSEGVEWATELAVTQYGLPWLDEFPDQDAVIAAFDADSESLGGAPALALDIADVHLAHGRNAEAESLLRDYASQVMTGGHRGYVVEYLRERGLDEVADLADRPEMHELDEQAWADEVRAIYRRGEGPLPPGLDP